MTIVKKINLFAVVMLITGAIDSIRNMSAVALFGSSLIFYLLLGLILFLWPIAVIAADLSANWSEHEPGIFSWTRQACGERFAIITIWLQWINTVIWFPTILSFVAGTVAYLIDPSLAQSKHYLAAFIVILFWSLTIINLLGVYVSAKIAEYGALFGMIIPVLGLTVLGLFWLHQGHTSHLIFTWQAVFPNFKHTDHFMSLTAIITSFLGIELSAVHMNKMHRPNQTFPQALLISGVIIIVTILLGASTIAMVLPSDQLSLVSGIMQTFQLFLANYHLEKFLPVITVLILMGSVGGMVNWLISPAKGLAQIAVHGYLPAVLAKQNKAGVNHYVLLIQAVIVSGLSVLFLYMPSVNASYWLLTALSTQLYVMMYVMMLIAAIILRRRLEKPKADALFKTNSTYYLTCAMGLLGCILTLIVGFIPPDNIQIGSRLSYELEFVSGIVLLTLPLLIICYYPKLRQLRARPS